MNDQPILDKLAVRTAFARAAEKYDAAAVVQREVATRLLERLDLIRLVPARILDLGCGTGALAHALAKRFGGADIAGVDLARPMLVAARRRTPWSWLPRVLRRRERWVNADAESLPFAADTFDLVISNFMLQWCDADRVLQEAWRVLRPGGLLLFSTFGPDTLVELRAAWRAADAGVHVHDFTDMHDLGDALVRLRFADPVMDAERITLTYKEVNDLLRDLKMIGAHNAATARRAALTGKARFARFRAAYEAFRGEDGRLPATHEVIYGHAWKPEAKTVRISESGANVVSLESLKRRGS